MKYKYRIIYRDGLFQIQHKRFWFQRWKDNVCYAFLKGAIRSVKTQMEEDMKHGKVVWKPESWIKPELLLFFLIPIFVVIMCVLVAVWMLFG